MQNEKCHLNVHYLRIILNLRYILTGINIPVYDKVIYVCETVYAEK